MSRWHAYLNSARKIIASYTGDIPLSGWLKAFFASHKQMGSTDRRWISGAVYSYYRLGHALKNIPDEERILTAFFLANMSPHPLLQQVRPEWDKAMDSPIAEKIRFLHLPVLDDIFPWQDQLSDSIDNDLFNLSFLQQPDVFLRLRPGHRDKVLLKLTAAGQSFLQISEACISLPNTTKLDQFVEIDKEAVIQDYSSQRTGDYLAHAGPSSRKVWDCCAASGGKSIMAYDLDPSIQLTVSDVRDSILHNLRKRFQSAGIKNYRAYTADLSQPLQSGDDYDLILADLPCSGSGTWARTPEQLFFYDPKKTDAYSDLQKKILLNVIPHLRPRGRLVYITCSVFKKENEEVAVFVRDNTGLKLEKTASIKGYDVKADSMFVAVFEKGA